MSHPLPQSFTLNFTRLHQSIDDFAQIGRDPHRPGLYRPAFSKANDQARLWLKNELNKSKIEFREDGAYNLIARIGPQEGSIVATGSHIDTVPGGGHLDGAYGVLAGLEVLRSIQEQEWTLKHPLELLIFTDEEGRFGSMIGSKSMCGQLSQQDLEDAQDETGRSLKMALEKRGKSLESAYQAHRKNDTFKAFIELHIEQGPVLDQQELSIGVVDSIVGIRRWRASYFGQSNHAGTTPMHLRKDAMMGFVDFAQKLKTLIQDQNRDSARATLGRVVTHPGYIGVIANQVDFTLDLRDATLSDLEDLDQALEQHARQSATQHQLGFELVRVGQLDPLQCDPDLTDLIAKQTQQLDLPSMRMPSGALHDALTMAHLAPVSMIFVPSLQGLSHSSLEETHPHHLEQGALVLGRTLLSLAVS